eukprot:5592603-Prymnesium_polylepis.1
MLGTNKREEKRGGRASGRRAVRTAAGQSIAHGSAGPGWAGSRATDTRRRDGACLLMRGSRGKVQKCCGFGYCRGGKGVRP